MGAATDLSQQLVGAGAHRVALDATKELSQVTPPKGHDAEAAQRERKAAPAKSLEQIPETSLTAKQRELLVQSVVDAGPTTSKLSETAKTALVQELTRANAEQRLNIDEVKKFVKAMDESLSWSRPEYRAQLEQGFTALLKNNIDLRQKDRAGTSLLEHVTTLVGTSSNAFMAGLGSRKDELVASLLTEIANPNANINQGRDTSCVTTVGQNQFVKQSPAEYARIISELATQGKARLVVEVKDPATGQTQRQLSDWVNGPHLQLDSQTVLNHNEAQQKRSVTETMLQASAGRTFGAVRGGLYNGAAERMYEQIFGRSFERQDDFTSFEREVRRTLQEGGTNMASIKWMANGTHANHAVEILKIENGQVYFRNPQGKEFQEVPKGVPATKVDGETATYKMSLADMRQQFNWGLTSSDETRGLIAFNVTKGCQEERVSTRPGVVEPRTIFFDVTPTLVGGIPAMEIPLASKFQNPKSSPTGQEPDKKDKAATRTAPDEEEHLETMLAGKRRKT